MNLANHLKPLGALSNRSIATGDMEYATQRQFTLSGSHTEDTMGTFLDFALRALHEQPDEVNTVFFGRANVDYLQSRISRDVRKLTGFAIGRQSDETLVQIMVGIYAERNSTRARNGGPRAEVSYLNNRVMRACVPQCVEGVAAYSGYVRDSSRPMTPMPHPVNTSMTGNDPLPSWL